MQSVSGNDGASYAGQRSSKPPEIIPGVLSYRIFDVIPELVREYVNGTETLNYKCGYGHSSELLRSLGLNVDAADFGKRTLNAVEIGNYYILQGNGSNPMCPDERYDFVYSSFTWFEITDDNRKELFNWVAEIARVMKRGGTFMTTVNRDDADDESVVNCENEFKNDEDLKPSFNYFWINKHFHGALKNAGLIIECIHEPRATNEDGPWWSIKKILSPVVIYVARKL